MTDKKEIEQLFKAHYATMLRLAAILLHDEEIARDIVHDVFTSMLYATTDVPLSLSYLSSAVRNRCLNHIRNCTLHDRLNNGLMLDMSEYDDDDNFNEETLTAIESIVTSGLPDQCRKVIELRFSTGLKVVEIAAIMNVSENAVYKNLRQAFSIIRKKLDRHG